MCAISFTIKQQKKKKNERITNEMASRSILLYFTLPLLRGPENVLIIIYKYETVLDITDVPIVVYVDMLIYVKFIHLE